MTLLDEAKGLEPVPASGERRVEWWQQCSIGNGKKAELPIWHDTVSKDYAQALEQRLAIAVRALREYAGSIEGNNWQELFTAKTIRALADALQVLPPTERSKDTI